jgi:hypothetical protein
MLREARHRVERTQEQRVIEGTALISRRKVKVAEGTPHGHGKGRYPALAFATMLYA